jgi:predicted nucleic acid-binding protein
MRVYVETTIVSYMTSRPSRDPITAARQQLTREWWDRSRDELELYVSELVLEEAGRGDPEAARKRLALLADIPRLPATEIATDLAAELLQRGAMPASAAEDALHIALATTHRMHVLVTWNLSHIANPEMLWDVYEVVRSMDCQPPIICTPEALAALSEELGL